VEVVDAALTMTASSHTQGRASFCTACSLVQFEPEIVGGKVENARVENTGVKNRARGNKGRKQTWEWKTRE